MYLKQIFSSSDITCYSIEIEREVSNLLRACTLIITGNFEPIFTLDIQEECFIKSGIVFLLTIRKGNSYPKHEMSLILKQTNKTKLKYSILNH